MSWGPQIQSVPDDSSAWSGGVETIDLLRKTEAEEIIHESSAWLTALLLQVLRALHAVSFLGQGPDWWLRKHYRYGLWRFGRNNILLTCKSAVGLLLGSTLKFLEENVHTYIVYIEQKNKTKQADIKKKCLVEVFEKKELKALRNGRIDLNQSYLIHNSDSLTDLLLQEIKRHTADTPHALQPLGPDRADKGW